MGWAPCCSAPALAAPLSRCVAHGTLSLPAGTMEFDLDESQLDVLRPLSAHGAPKTTCELFGRSTSPSPSAPYQQPELSTAAACITTAPCSPAIINRPGSIQHSPAAMHLSGRSSRPLHLHVFPSALDSSLVCTHIILYRAPRTLCVLSYYFRCKANSYFARIT